MNLSPCSINFVKPQAEHLLSPKPTVPELLILRGEGSGFLCASHQEPRYFQPKPQPTLFPLQTQRGEVS